MALIKPDAYASHITVADIVRRIREDGFKIVGEEEVRMTEDVAKEFYREHEGKGFYADLVGWMSRWVHDFLDCAVLMMRGG